MTDQDMTLAEAAKLEAAGVPVLAVKRVRQELAPLIKQIEDHQDEVCNWQRATGREVVGAYACGACNNGRHGLNWINDPAEVAAVEAFAESIGWSLSGVCGEATCECQICDHNVFDPDPGIFETCPCWSCKHPA